LDEPLQLNKLKDAKGPLSVVTCHDRVNMTVSEQTTQATLVTLYPSKQPGDEARCFATYID
jgi:hypothetical protein